MTSITDSVGNQTTYTYDLLNRQITDTNQLGKTRTLSYDAVGNRIKTLDRNGRAITYNYDVLDRETSENWLDASNAVVRTFASTYDAVGHLLTSLDPDSKYTYTYDAIDRITSVDNTETVGIPAVKFNYGYDAVGNLLTVNDSINSVNAGVTAYTYDLLNRATRLTQSGTGVSNKRVDLSYNAVDRLTSISRFSDLTGTNAVAGTNYVYDSNQRLIQLSHKKGASTIASYDYSYDANNRLTRTVSSIDGTNDYSYDGTNQLTGTDHSSQTDEAYSYDANGNRTYGGYVTGLNNQLLSDGTYNYQYDDEGNRTRRTEIATGKVTEYVWDYRNRLTSVLFKDGAGVVTKTIDYIYDGDNQRIGKRIDGAVTERYVIDRNQIALVFDGSGTQTHRYLYGTQIDQILTDETATGMVWALADNQGTVRDLIDNNGVVVNHVTYDSYGQIVGQTNAGVGFRYGYTGREQDAETGLDYYRARYYDSSNGRFISEDPLGFGAGDGNLTRYVGNSSTNYIDPTGKTSRDLIALLTIAQPRSAEDSIYFYPESTDYFTALAKSITWFHLITDSNPSKRKGIPVNNPKVPQLKWLLNAPLKVEPSLTSSAKVGGNGSLRPAALSGDDPTIDLQKDRDGNRHQTPGHRNATEIKFRWKDSDKSCPIIPPVPNVNSNPYPQGEKDYPDPVPVPVYPTEPAPSQTTPWWMRLLRKVLLYPPIYLS